MAGNAEIKPEALPDLDDLLQCPVCYEIPSGQIFQCNEGHHVCGRCKVRLDMCPVCRALFFGTRNYAMEELIANVRKLRAFKLGGKVTTGTDLAETVAPANTSTPETINETLEEEDNNIEETDEQSAVRPPQACKGLFRCLCCKTGNGERLPAARLLNHLRYYHSPDLIEGKSENGEYLQLWQLSTVPGRLVTAVRVSDMGIFFLIIEITNDSICTWLSMAASPWVAHVFSYTVTISGNDREAIFSDCVWSVRSCEGTLKKRGHCLMLNGSDARALTAPVSISGKLSIRRTPIDQQLHLTQPRVVLRVANRGNSRDNGRAAVSHDLEPFLQDLQNDVARLSRAFASFGRGNQRSDGHVTLEPRPRVEAASRANPPAVNGNERAPASPPVETAPNNQNNPEERAPLSRNARRRLRQRLRAALNAPQPPAEIGTANTQRLNGQVTPAPRQNGVTANNPVVMTGLAIVQQPPVPPPPVPPPTTNGNHVRTNRRRRHRR